MAETGVDLANPRQGRLKTDDIPVALRQLPSTKGQQMQFPWLAMVAGFGSIALVGMAWVVMPFIFLLPAPGVYGLNACRLARRTLMTGAGV